jgi:RNA binding exosome subunit
MTEVKIGSISVETFCHATEDLPKVQDALKTLCNLKDVKDEDIALTKSYVYGGYGNMIVVLKTELSQDPLKTIAFENLNSKMSHKDKQILYQNFDRLVDGKHFFARYHKQIALQGGVKIATEDSIRVKIHFDMGFAKKNQNAGIIKQYCLATHFIEKED